MNTENDLVDIDTPATGVQNDGEPVAVVPAATDGEPAAAVESENHEDSETDSEPPRKKTGSQRQKERAQRLAEENEMLRRMLLEGKKTEPATAPLTPTGKPRQEDFETHEAWVEAVTDWKVEAKLAEKEAKQKATQRQETWEQKATAAREKFEDYDDALEAAEAPTMIVAEVLNESPIGGELAYHLATHPDEYQKINRMAPAAAALALGRIEARLTAAPAVTAPPSKKVTQAPKPPVPVSARAAAAPTDDGRLETY